jgi:hypothetical protein
MMDVNHLIAKNLIGNLPIESYPIVVENTDFVLKMIMAEIAVDL